MYTSFSTLQHRRNKAPRLFCERQIGLSSQAYQRDICRFLNRDTDLNQTLLDANGALSQMSYGEVLNLSWKDSISLIKAVISFHYEYLLSALQFAPQTSDLIQQLTHIEDSSGLTGRLCTNTGLSDSNFHIFYHELLVSSNRSAQKIIILIKAHWF